MMTIPFASLINVPSNAEAMIQTALHSEMSISPSMIMVMVSEAFSNKVEDGHVFWMFVDGLPCM